MMSTQLIKELLHTGVNVELSGRGFAHQLLLELIYAAKSAGGTIRLTHMSGHAHQLLLELCHAGGKNLTLVLE